MGTEVVLARESVVFNGTSNMRPSLGLLTVSALAACSTARKDPVISPQLDSGITSSNDGGIRALGNAQRRRDHPHHAMKPLVAGLLTKSVIAWLSAVLLAAPAAQAQRNGDEYGGKNHQPTRAEVERRERRGGVIPPPAEAGADRRTVDQLDRQLLHEEKVDPPGAALPR